MRTGPMRQRVTVQTLAESQDNYGQKIQSWTSTGSFWAEIKNLSGRELVNAKQVKADASHQVRMRYVAALFPTSGLLPSMRLLFGASVYHILWINNVDNRQREYLLLCQEIVSPSAN